MNLAQTDITALTNTLTAAIDRYGAPMVVLFGLGIIGVLVLRYMSQRAAQTNKIDIAQAEILSAVIRQLGETTANFTRLTEKDHQLREAENGTRAKISDQVLVTMQTLADSVKEYPARMIADVLTGVRTIADDNLKAYTRTQVNVAEELGTMSETNGKLSAAIEELKTQIEQLKDEIKGTVIIGHNQATKLTDTLNAVLLALTEISSKIDTQTMQAAVNTPPSPLIETKETE